VLCIQALVQLPPLGEHALNSVVTQSTFKKQPTTANNTVFRLVSEFSARSGLIPLKVTCGTNFTVVVHSNPHESTSSELENTNFHGPPQTAELESSTEASTSVWFKKLQTVDGFLDEQLQASALCDSTIASAQLETSASLKSNLFLGRSIESRQFVPFPEVRSRSHGMHVQFRNVIALSGYSCWRARVANSAIALFNTGRKTNGSHSAE
jgi:hypothetical protein